MKTLKIPGAWEKLAFAGDDHVGEFAYDPELQKTMGPGYDGKLLDLLTVGDSPRDSYVIFGEALPTSARYIVRSKFLLPEGTRENPIKYRVVPRFAFEDLDTVVVRIDVVLDSDPGTVVVRIDVRPERLLLSAESGSEIDARVGQIDVTWVCLEDNKKIVKRILDELSGDGCVEILTALDLEKNTYLTRSKYFDEVPGLGEVSLRALVQDEERFNLVPRYGFNVTDTGEVVPAFADVPHGVQMRKIKVELSREGDERPREPFFVYVM